MEVDFALLADAAEVSNGKLYVIGGAIDTVWSAALPVVHPRLSFIMRLLISPAEVGRKHTLEVHIMDEDGRRIATVGGGLETARNANLPPGWKHGFLSVLNFANLQFEKFGNYNFEIVINNSSLKSIPFRIAQRPQPPAA
jgi:hypothetical protein